MTVYVLGFILTSNGVYLIHKKRGPSNVVNHWNGIGGKVHYMESAHDAMERKALEEVGKGAMYLDWTCFGHMGFSSPDDAYAWTCWLFVTEFLETDPVPPATTTDEEIRWFSTDEDLPSMVDNAPMLMELARFVLANKQEGGPPSPVHVDLAYR